VVREAGNARQESSLRLWVFVVIGPVFALAMLLVAGGAFDDADDIGPYELMERPMDIPLSLIAFTGATVATVIRARELSRRRRER
jgi:hypothetical protein